MLRLLSDENFNGDIVRFRRIITMKEFSVIIEKDEEGFFVASVQALCGCHTQAKSLDTLMKRKNIRMKIMPGCPKVHLIGLSEKIS